MGENQRLTLKSQKCTEVVSVSYTLLLMEMFPFDYILTDIFLGTLCYPVLPDSINKKTRMRERDKGEKGKGGAKDDKQQNLFSQK